MTKKNIMFVSISLILIMLLGIGVSYSMWNISVTQDNTNTAYTDCFDLTISNKENNISLENAYPISNSKGMKLTPYTFTVTNTCDITAEYSINLEVLKNSTLASNFIDVMLDGNINLLSSYDKTEKIDSSSIESRKIDTGILKSKESKDYSLRLWIDYDTTMEDLNNEVKVFKAKVNIVGKPINYTGDIVFNFDYTGGEQTFTAPVSGTYKLETWGAQGGYRESYKGGYGGYSSGYVKLSKDTNVYINAGGKGDNYSLEKISYGGYNGGGYGGITSASANYKLKQGGSGGGGATHIATKSGLLKSLENSQEDILIVSGGGGGGATISDGDNSVTLFLDNSSCGGGITGNNGGYSNNFVNYKGIGATQKDGGYDYITSSDYGQFGKGSDLDECGFGGNGGGGGFYGGGGTNRAHSGAGGGSGYIGNTLLTNKIMYCYNFEESSEVSTKTVSTTCSEETPTSYCAKKGNGYARITLISIIE